MSEVASSCIKITSLSKCFDFFCQTVSFSLSIVSRYINYRSMTCMDSIVLVSENTVVITFFPDWRKWDSWFEGWWRWIFSGHGINFIPPYHFLTKNIYLENGSKRKRCGCRRAKIVPVTWPHVLFSLFFCFFKRVLMHSQRDWGKVISPYNDEVVQKNRNRTKSVYPNEN